MEALSRRDSPSIHLASRLPSGHGRLYGTPEAAAGADSPLVRFCTEIPDVIALERLIQKNLWPEVAARVYSVKHPLAMGDRGEGADAMLPLVVQHYRRVMHSGMPICPIPAVIEATQIELLVEASRLLTFDVAMRRLSLLQKSRPKDVRFHVDRHGKPAFLKLSDDIIATFCSWDIAK